MRLDETLKAFSEKNRLAIIELLLSRDYCVRSLANRLEISESAASQHLKRLKDADLVEGKQKGHHIHYKVKKGNLRALAKQIEALAEIEKDCCRSEKDPCGEHHEDEACDESSHEDGCCQEETSREKQEDEGCCSH